MTHTVTLKNGLSFDVKTSSIEASMVFFDMIIALDPFRWGGVVIVPKWIKSVTPGLLGGLPEEDGLVSRGGDGVLVRRRPVPAFSDN